MSPPRAEAPTPGVLVAGGVGVLAVIGFVAAVVFGGEARAQPGDRVALAATEEGPVLVAGRCEDERVTAVELKAPDGPTLWRITSAKGSITRRYVVGGEVPVGFETVTPFQGLPEGHLEAVVEIDRDLVDRRVVAQPLADTAQVAPPCGRSQDLGAVAVLFVAGALLVVTAYAAMVWRWLEDRRR